METHSQGHTEGMMGLARCRRKMILPGMVYMSQKRIIEVLQYRKDEDNELMLVENVVQVPISPSSLISFIKRIKTILQGGVKEWVQSHSAAIIWMAVIKEKKKQKKREVKKCTKEQTL